MELQHRRPMPAHHFDAGPEHALRLAGAERLHRRFLRRKARRERRREVLLALAIGDLAFSEHPADEAVTVALDRVLDAIDLRGIEAGSYNGHVSVRSYTSLPEVAD